MDLRTVVKQAIDPALRMLPASMDSPEARVMLLAIGLQESRFEHRYQVTNSGAPGPARGFWQFEEGGGAKGVCRHPASRLYMQRLCEATGHEFTPAALWRAIAADDVLAAGAARLLLFTDPRKLPKLGDVPGAWAYYWRNWRPGRERPETWDEMYQRALKEVT